MPRWSPCDEITGLEIPSTLPCDISSWPSALQCSVISYSQWLLSPYHTSLTVFSLVSGSITSISFIDDNVWLTASAYSMTTCSTSVYPRQYVMLLAVSVSTIRVCSPHYLIANTWRFLHPPIPANCPLIFLLFTCTSTPFIVFILTVVHAAVKVTTNILCLPQV